MKELGELMRAARHHKHVALEEAAAQTRIGADYLSAIEDGQLNRLPGSAYIAGFLRNYATYLDLNPDEVLETYHSMTPRPTIAVHAASTLGLARLRRRGRRRLKWAAAAVVLAVLGGAAIYNKYDATPAQARQGPGLESLITGLHPSGHHSASGANTLSEVRVRATHHAWISVRVDGSVVFWHPLRAGQVRTWVGHGVSVRTRHPGRIRVWANGVPARLITGKHHRAHLHVPPRLPKPLG